MNEIHIAKVDRACVAQFCCQLRDVVKSMLDSRDVSIYPNALLLSAERTSSLPSRHGFGETTMKPP